jgi:arsenate reductase-like glutaredoxin family protein
MTPTVQIIGIRNSQDTRKADRFFRERGIRPHFVDLKERPLSSGELQNICRHIDPEQLLDRSSKAFVKAGLAYMVYDPMEEALKNPQILRTPIVRFGREVTVGLEPEIWTGWLQDRG